MIKILFVCHGNICRSPMAEFVFKDIVHKNKMDDRFDVKSAATSREEIGSDMYPPAKRKLTEKGVPISTRKARQMTLTDCEYYDHIILMDQNNLRNYKRLFGDIYLDKVHLLMEFTGIQRDVEDPWYTGDFETAFLDIKMGCEALFTQLREEM